MIFKETDDSIRDFIEEKMSEVDSKVYTKEDFNVYFTHKHINFTVLDDFNNIMAFCCIICLDNKRFMGYSWCDKTHQGIKAYSKGLQYVIKNYPDVLYDMDIIPKYIIKRIT